MPNQGIGIVTKVNGNAYAERGGVRVQLHIGSELDKSDVLLTDDSGKLEVRFADNAEVSLGPSSSVEVRDFVFDESGQEKPSFDLHIIEGLVRSSSGKIVEQDPSAFKLSTPQAVIGIRGTITVHKVSAGSEFHSVEHIGAGHTVVVSSSDGRSAVISESLQGLNMVLGSYEPLKVETLTKAEMDSLTNSMKANAAQSGNSRGFFILGDEAFMADATGGGSGKRAAFIGQSQAAKLLLAIDNMDSDVSGTDVMDALSSSGAADSFDSLLSSMVASLENSNAVTEPTAPEVVTPPVNPEPVAPPPTVTEPAPTPPPTVSPTPPPPTPTPPPTVTPTPPPTTPPTVTPTPPPTTPPISGSGGGGDDNISVPDGITVYGMEGNDSISKTGNLDAYTKIYGDVANLSNNAVGGSDSIVISGEITGGMISGDSATISGGASGGNDSILAGGLSAGAVYGDASSRLTDSYGGNDTINIAAISGGSVFGDGKILENESTGGNDYIVTSAMSSGVIYGDGHEIKSNSVGGNDTIIVGSMSSGIVYGDAFSLNGGNSKSGDDVITINNMSGGLVYGDGSLYHGNLQFGNDSISITNMSGGSVFGGGGNDTVKITGNFTGGVISTGSGNDHFDISGFGGNGVKVINSGLGADTYIFGNNLTDSASVTISNFASDTLDLSAYGASNVTGSISGDNLVLTANSGTHTLTITLSGVNDSFSSLQQSGNILL